MPLEDRGSFRAELIEWEQSNSLGLDEQLAVHKRFIRPIVAAADECFVYGLAKGSEALERCAAILRPARGKHVVDHNQEAVVGYESLWNSCAPDRGSIVVSLPVEKFDRSLFRHVRRCYVVGNPQASNTASAIKYCTSMAQAGKLAFCFDFHSARNVQIYGPLNVLQDLYASLPKSKLPKW